MRPNSADDDEQMNEFQKIYDQLAVCANPGVRENFVDGFEPIELMRHNTPKYEDVRISFKDFAPVYLINEPPEIDGKNDDQKKFYEQTVVHPKIGFHAKLAEDFEIAELTKYNTLKPEDERNRSKEYFDWKEEGQNDSYDITSSTNSSPRTRCQRPMRTPMTVQILLHW